MKKKLIIIAGPTAVGKTASSVMLAEMINGEIISADSMQIYKNMDIGTAKATKSEMMRIPHYMIDEINVDEEFNVFEFQKKVYEYMEEIYKKGKIPIIVGGTGFYIQSIIYDINFENNDEDVEYKVLLECEARTFGNEYIHEKLKKIDPISYEKIHPNNVKRVIRALEFYRINKYPISEHNEKESKKESKFDLNFFVLNCEDRNKLYDRINKRVDIMVNDGLLDEVKGIYSEYNNRNLNALQGIGYKEIIEYLEGEASYDEAIEKIKQNTRNFAKRQITWFKREKNVKWINSDKLNFDNKLIVEEMIKNIKSGENDDK